MPAEGSFILPGQTFSSSKSTPDKPAIKPALVKGRVLQVNTVGHKQVDIIKQTSCD